jgi:hypothetical protein
MKKQITIRLLAFILTTLILYLIVAFVKFNLNWVKEIPNYSNEDRGFILFTYTGIQIVVQLLIFIKK